MENRPKFYAWLTSKPKQNRALEDCPFCGDLWLNMVQIDYTPQSGRGIEFDLLNTCCEEFCTELERSIHDPWLNEGWEYLMESTNFRRALGEPLGLRQIYLRRDPLVDTPAQMDFGLVVKRWYKGCGLNQKDIKDFLRTNHRHNAPPVQWKFCHLIFNGKPSKASWVGVVWTGRPVARQIDHSTTLEVNRLCLDHNLNRALTWKAASLGYKAAAREAANRGYRKIITYTLAEEEDGKSLRYARWKKDGPPTKGGSWNSPSRPRTDKAPTSPKQRWSKPLISGVAG